MSELIFVGYTNGSQIKYAQDDEGCFYPDTDNECYIPLYMLKTHQHRVESTSKGEYALVKSDHIAQLEKDKAELVEFLRWVYLENEVECMKRRKLLERMK